MVVLTCTGASLVLLLHMHGPIFHLSDIGYTWGAIIGYEMRGLVDSFQHGSIRSSLTFIKPLVLFFRRLSEDRRHKYSLVECDFFSELYSLEKDLEPVRNYKSDCLVLRKSK